MEQQLQDKNDDEAPYVDKLEKALSAGLPNYFPDDVTQVLDHLYIGSERNAVTVPELQTLGITHVINCVEGYPLLGYIHTGQDFYGDIKYLGFDSKDDDDYDILQHFQECFEFIEQARLSGGKVLVHCIVGINRSGAICCAYCMVHKNMGPITASRHMLKVRYSILTNTAFQRQLVSFAKQRGLLHLDRAEIS